MHGRLDSDGLGYTPGYGSVRVVILSTGLVRVRITALCYGYGSGSKKCCRPTRRPLAVVTTFLHGPVMRSS